MFSYPGSSPSRPHPPRRGGPARVDVILRNLDVTLVERYLTTGEQGLEHEPGAGRPSPYTSYPQAA